MIRILSLLAALFWGAAAPAQDMAPWPNLDAMILSNLTDSGTAEAAFWLPDGPDPAQVTQGLGVAYEYIQGSAGSVSIAVGYFVRGASGWQYVGPVQGLFGQSPRAPMFAPGVMELTTTTLGPNEPRCCPTQETRWRIDLAQRVAQRLN